MIPLLTGVTAITSDVMRGPAGCRFGRPPFDLVAKPIWSRWEGADHAERRPVSPGPTCRAREGLSGVPRRRCHGQMASAERFHGEGSPFGRQGRWYLQNVVHEFHDGEQPLVRWRVSRAGATRAHPAHRPIRRSEPARRDAHDDHLEEGLLRHRTPNRARGPAGCDPARGMLSRMARITHAPSKARRSRDSGLARREAPVILALVKSRARGGGIAAGPRPGSPA